MIMWSFKNLLLLLVALKQHLVDLVIKHLADFLVLTHEHLRAFIRVCIERFV